MLSKRIQNLRRIAESIGLGSCTTFEHTRKAITVIITGPLGTRKVFAALTPSDHRANLNFKSDLRRYGREVGAIA